MDWSLSEHPPFDATDKGYRDALIWATVCEVAESASVGSTTVFITEDRDFRDGKSNNLHPFLVSHGASITGNSIVLAESIDAAIALTNMDNVITELRELPYDLDQVSTRELLEDRISSFCDQLVGESPDDFQNISDRYDGEIKELTIWDAVPELSTMSVDIAEYTKVGRRSELSPWTPQSATKVSSFPTLTKVPNQVMWVAMI